MLVLTASWAAGLPVPLSTVGAWTREKQPSGGQMCGSAAGIAEIAWASQKRYISLYVLRADVLDAHRGQLAGLDVGKGCIRYRRLV